MARTVDASPQAASFIETMRDIGYSLETAVADIIDNSITAGATRVRLFAEKLQGGFTVAVADDGRGMSEAELLDALRPGCRNPLADRGEDDLGRFGLGLKTASFSQCRRLTVLTSNGLETTAARWDLDFVAQTNKWLVQVLDDVHQIPYSDLLDQSGTVVVWENLDRIVGGLEGAEATRHFDERLSDLADHLELVFHRFLAGRPWVNSRVAISLNERPLKPFDPFHVAHSATQKSPLEQIPLQGSTVDVQAYTLPHHSKVKTDEWRKYAGSEGYLKNQGFYVYRENRLILYGTWFGLARQSELTKLARVRIDFTNEMDALWKIDVRKASAQPPPEVRRHLRGLVERIAGTSKRVYTHRGTTLPQRSQHPVWERRTKDGRISYRVRLDYPVIDEFVERLPSELKQKFERLLDLVSAAFPVDSLFADLGGKPEDVANSELDEAVIRDGAVTLYKQLCKSGLDRLVVRETILAAEPYSSNANLTRMIFDEIDSHGELS